MKLLFNVLNLNEHKPAFEEEKEKYVYIKENLPVGDVVVELKATDGDVDSNVSCNKVCEFYKQNFGQV